MARSNFPQGDHYMEPTPIGTWIRSPGVRETVESVLIAILLALLFRFFEAEAFIIPTGSMAPDLQGLHVDVQCPKCEYQYRAGVGRDTNEQIVPNEKCACPICQYPLLLRRHERRDHREFSGDRILVNKFAYDFGQPERFDVIVFKYPNNGKQNFIKRLIGLPNEGVLIEYGDIHTYDRRSETFDDRKIAHKTPRKLQAMLQLVDDTNYIAEELIEAGWPSRWDQWTRTGAPSDWTVSRDPVAFSLDNPTDEFRWLRYRHLRPRTREWDKIEDGELPDRMSGEIPPGELITDHYAYNDVMPKGVGQFTNRSGLHWVGDLSVEAFVDIKSDTGSIVIELVEGGVRFTCTINVADGTATFAASDSAVTFGGDVTGQTAISGSGQHQLQFANADDKLFLWVDGRYVDIPGAEFTRTGDVMPKWSETDPGDAEPLGIGGRNIQMDVSRLRVLRDIYYTSKNDTAEQGGSVPWIEYTLGKNPADIRDILATPHRWELEADRQGVPMFKSRARDESYVFELEEGQLLPMGDNSPQSNDARIWAGERYIDSSYLLGEALFIYWPHAKTKPLPFWPNFERMKFIR